MLNTICWFDRQAAFGVPMGIRETKAPHFRFPVQASIWKPFQFMDGAIPPELFHPSLTRSPFVQLSHFSRKLFILEYQNILDLARLLPNLARPCHLARLLITLLNSFVLASPNLNFSLRTFGCILHTHVSFLLLSLLSFSFYKFFRINCSRQVQCTGVQRM